MLRRVQIKTCVITVPGYDCLGINTCVMTVPRSESIDVKTCAISVPRSNCSDVKTNAITVPNLFRQETPFGAYAKICLFGREDL